ncbi:hypothetical protein CCACVL1_05109 [Corchorus capsularis]|uniref:Uncharacterized protein n=1 Tax=Corchorus capsularis TaxID=210143 RepID=A0A1R3JMT0_COCAP|nr:hypothetical protein CCACVL1_05109 [Corchorus capsularis]
MDGLFLLQNGCESRQKPQASQFQSPFSSLRMPWKGKNKEIFNTRSDLNSTGKEGKQSRENVIAKASFNRSPHVINFRWRNLYPQGMAWDPSAEHFIVGSMNQRSIHSVSDAGVIETIVSNPTLPENVTVLGLTVDSTKKQNAYSLASTQLLLSLPSTHSLPTTSEPAAASSYLTYPPFDYLEI